MGKRYKRIIGITLILKVLMFGFDTYAQTTMTLPAHVSNYSGNSRGMWFTAPTNFTITGIRAPNEIGTNAQTIHLVKFAAIPPTYSTTTTVFTTLFYQTNIAGANFVSMNIPVSAGDVIGVMAVRNNGSGTSLTSYSATGSPFTSSINGQSVSLYRLGWQGNIIPGPAVNFWTEASAAIGRVDIQYVTTFPTNAGLTKFLLPQDTVCSGPRMVTATLKNYGPNVMTTCNINWKVNNVTQTQLNWSGNLAVNDSVSVSLGSYNFIYGTIYNIMAASSFPNSAIDSFPANDTVKKNEIFVKQAPSAMPTVIAATICAGDSVQIGGSFTGSPPWNMTISDGTYSYSYPGLILPGFAQYVSPTSTTTYTVTSLTDASGCSAVGIPPVVVTVNPQPAANAGGNRAICSGTSTTLGTTAVTGNTYIWSPVTALNNATVSNPIATPASTTTYTLTETKTATSCFKQNTVVVTVNAKPIPNAGSNQTIASGGTTTLPGSASGGSGFYLYQWKPAAFLINPNIANPTTTVLSSSKVFTLIVTDSLKGCMDSATTTVFVSGGTLSSITSATSVAVCSGVQTQLLALPSGGSGNYTYNWSSVPAGFTGNTSNPSVSPLVTTKYFVSINDGTNNKLDSILITVYPIPTAFITPATATTFCQGGSVILNANTGTGLSYKWYKDNVLQTPQTASFTATIGGSYIVVVTNGNNCSVSSAATIVTVNPNPVASFTLGGPSTICLNDSVLCTANAGTAYTYQWMLNASPISGATAQTYYAKQAGSLTVVVSNSYPCSTTSSAQTITIVNPPTAAITPLGPTNFCFGLSCALSATTGTGLSYVWLKNGGVIVGATGSTYTATTAGSYRVRVSNTTGCFDTSAVVVLTTINAPVANITASGNTTFCQPDSVLLTATIGTAYLYTWKLNGVAISGATAFTFYAKTTGSYSVDISNTSCTTPSNAIAVIAYTPPVATVLPSGPVSFCLGDSVYLSTSTGSGYTHQWYRNNVAINGATTSYIFIKTAGSYHVVISVGGGACTATSAQLVATITTISATIGYSGSPYCNNLTSVQNVSLTGASGGSFSSTTGLSINASSGAITPNTSTAGTYTVTYTIAPSGNCPGFTTSTSVSIISFPAAAGTITSNHNDSVNVGENNAVYKTTPIVGATTYVWSYSGNGAIFMPSATTTVDSVKINFAGNATSGNLTVKGHNSCGDGTVSATYPIYVSTVGINEISNALNCQIYPNPTSGLITLTINGISSSLDLQLFDIIGKLIYEEKLTLKTHSITKNLDLSAYPKGIYFIKISNDKIQYIQKLIKN